MKINGVWATRSDLLNIRSRVMTSSLLSSLQLYPDIDISSSSVTHVHGVKVRQQTDSVQHGSVVLVDAGDVGGGGRCCCAAGADAALFQQSFLVECGEVAGWG